MPTIPSRHVRDITAIAPATEIRKTLSEVPPAEGAAMMQSGEMSEVPGHPRQFALYSDMSEVGGRP
jgi:hypothetical protein